MSENLITKVSYHLYGLPTGQNFGLMVIKDTLWKKILWRKYVSSPRDGRLLHGGRPMVKGTWPPDIWRCHRCDAGPVSSATVDPGTTMSVSRIISIQHYLTQKPELKASKELLNLVNGIAKTDKESFIGALKEWYNRKKGIVNERVLDKRINKELKHALSTLQSLQITFLC